MRVLLVDNHDSFTWNLVQGFRIAGAEVVVFRNDAITPAEALALAPTHVVISPGPGRPEQAGRSPEILATFLGRRPLLGVCLGHQMLVQHLGGRIVLAPEAVHGKARPIVHDGRTLFRGCTSPMQVGRYHSLVAEPASLPASLEVSALTAEVIMGVRHPPSGAEGVQFHPESVLTPDGQRLLENFLLQT